MGDPAIVAIILVMEFTFATNQLKGSGSSGKSVIYPALEMVTRVELSSFAVCLGVSQRTLPDTLSSEDSSAGNRAAYR